MNRVKNIITVCDFAYISGGAEKVAIMSAISLAENGYNVTMFAGKGPVCDELLNSNVQVICLNQEEAIKDSNKARGIIRGIYNKAARKEMENLLSNFKPDDTVIHMHGWAKVFSSSIFTPIKKKQFKVAVTMHDYFLLCPNGCCYDFQNREICERKAMGMSCITCNCDKRNYLYKAYRILRQFVMKRLVQGTNLTLFFISNFNKAVSEHRIPFCFESKMVLNPIEVQFRSRVSVKDNKNYIFIGRLSYEKGIDHFCEGVTRANVPAVVVGSGDRLEELRNKYPQIQFVGWKNKQEMEEYILSARALIFPSVWYEGAPLTIPEVMGGYALPCIVSDCSAGRDYIDSGKNGIVYKGSDTDELSKAISQTLNDDFLLQLQDNIFGLFDREQYSSSAYVSRLVECYEEMLGKD